MNRRQTILTIEDDTAIRCGIVDALQFSGYDTIESADGLSVASSKQCSAITTYCFWILGCLGFPGLKSCDGLANCDPRRR